MQKKALEMTYIFKISQGTCSHTPKGLTPSTLLILANWVRTYCILPVFLLKQLESMSCQVSAVCKKCRLKDFFNYLLCIHYWELTVNRLTWMLFRLRPKFMIHIPECDNMHPQCLPVGVSLGLTLISPRATLFIKFMWLWFAYSLTLLRE